MRYRRRHGPYLALVWGLLWAHTALAQQAVPALSGRVVDRADLISETTEQALISLLQAHEDSTTNQIAILTVPDLQGEAIEEFSLRVVEAWQLGQADRDNGVLLTIARDDRAMRIEVGYGLEGSLPDVLAGRIIRNEITPHFRSGNFDLGVLAGTQAIIGAIEGTYTVDEDAGGGDFDSLGERLFFCFMFIGMASLFGFFALFLTGCARWFLLLFLCPFFAVGFGVLTLTGAGAVVGVVLHLGVHFSLYNLPWFKEKRKTMAKHIKTTGSWGGSSGGGSSWSSSGSSWSSGGSSFSGGGGSFGGGGASGGW